MVIMIEKNLEKQSAKKASEFKVGDVIALSLKGHYKIETVEMMSFAGQPEPCYVLSSINDRTLHKTFVPKASAKGQGMRELASEKTIRGLEKFLKRFEVQPETLSWNSNKKMINYEKRVKKEGFLAAVDVYFCVLFDLKKTAREDKRYVAFLDRVKNFICFEISLSLGITIESAKDYFEEKSQVYLGH